MQKLYRVFNALRLILILSLVVILSFRLVFAQEIPPPPRPIKFVNDFAGMLEPSDALHLEDKLKKYADSTSTQIAIVIIRTLNNEDRVAYAQKLATAWGIGQMDKDNGLLILVAYDDHKIRIHTGYGLEAILTDLATAQIIDNQMIPDFRQKKYYEGLEEATNTIFKILSGEIKASDLPKPRRTIQQTINFFFYVILIAFLLGFCVGISYSMVLLKKKSIRENPYLQYRLLVIVLILLPMLLGHIILMDWYEAWEYYLWIGLIYLGLCLVFWLQSIATFKRANNGYGGNAWSSGGSYSDSGSSYSDSSFGGGSFGGGGASGDW
jgi:uncharacterized protein